MSAMSKKYKTQNNWIVDFPRSVSNPKYQSKKGKTVPVFYTPNAITLKYFHQTYLFHQFLI